MLARQTGPYWSKRVKRVIMSVFMLAEEWPESCLESSAEGQNVGVREENKAPSKR